jgi:hypothetical protein
MKQQQPPPPPDSDIPVQGPVQNYNQSPCGCGSSASAFLSLSDWYACCSTLLETEMTISPQKTNTANPCLVWLLLRDVGLIPLMRKIKRDNLFHYLRKRKENSILSQCTI